jgi:membrane protein DedA with SNARE-associated domain
MPDLAFLAANSVWLVYAAAVLAPFVQEDAATLGAATAATTGLADPVALFVLALLGLTLSDIWKYGGGVLMRRLAKKRPGPAKRLAMLETASRQRLGLMLLAARFIPGTRIPLYVACGALGVRFARFFPLLVLAGAAYIAAAFALVGLLGEAAKTHFAATLPLVAIGLASAALIALAFIHWRKRRPSSANGALHERPNATA